MRSPSRRQRGVSLVELLVGGAIGLLVTSAAAKLFVEHVRDNRRLLLDARLHQDLRAATDLVARDLRRAGYWQQALAGTTHPPRPNPYRVITPGAAAADSAAYSFSRDDIEDDVVDVSEATGFRLSQGSLQVLSGGGWQSLTDANVLRITRFSVTPEVRSIPLGSWCATACDPAAGPCPSLGLRSYRLQIGGEAAGDATVRREIHESVRVRNDALGDGSCP